MNRHPLYLHQRAMIRNNPHPPRRRPRLSRKTRRRRSRNAWPFWFVPPNFVSPTTIPSCWTICSNTFLVTLTIHHHLVVLTRKMSDDMYFPRRVAPRHYHVRIGSKWPNNCPPKSFCNPTLVSPRRWIGTLPKWKRVWHKFLLTKVVVV
jgi:hypothetical protein